MVGEIADVLNAPSFTASFTTAEAYGEPSSASETNYGAQIPDDDRAAATIQYAHLNEALDAHLNEAPGKQQDTKDPITKTVTQQVGLIINGDYVLKTVTKETIISTKGGSESYQISQFVDFDILRHAVVEDTGRLIGDIMERIESEVAAALEAHAKITPNVRRDLCVLKYTV